MPSCSFSTASFLTMSLSFSSIAFLAASKLASRDCHIYWLYLEKSTSASYPSAIRSFSFLWIRSSLSACCFAFCSSSLASLLCYSSYFNCFKYSFSFSFSAAVAALSRTLIDAALSSNSFSAELLTSSNYKLKASYASLINKNFTDASSL